MLTRTLRLIVRTRSLPKRQVRWYNGLPPEVEEEFGKTVEEIGCDDDGFLLKDSFYTEKTFRNSKFYQHMQKVRAEQERLIELKLKYLAQQNEVDIEELRKQLNERVDAQVSQARRTQQAINDNIAAFEREMSLPFKVDLVGDMLKILKFESDDLESSPVYQFMVKTDASLAQELRTLLARGVSAEQKTQLESRLRQGLWSESKRRELQELIKKRYDEFVNFKQKVDTEPISINEIFELLDKYPTFEQSDLYEVLREVDPRFGTLYGEVRSLAEGEERKLRRIQLNRLLADESSGIWKVLNDLESPEFKTVKSVLEDERAKFEPLSAESLVAYARIAEKDEDLEIFDSIDESLSVFLQKARDNENDERVVAEVHDLLTTEGPLKDFLEDTKSELYQKVQAKVNKARIKYHKEVVLNPLTKEIKSLAKEDQSNLSPEVAQINKYYDLFIQTMHELEQELKSGEYEPISSKVHLEAPSLLDREPTPQQLAEVQKINRSRRYDAEDDTLRFCAHMIMHGGKRQRARRYINQALYLVYLETRENPVDILKQVIDTVAPLVVTRVVKTGFAKNYSIPAPLTPRQRMRTGFKWILEASDSRASNDFPVRLAEEILNVYRGNSKLLEKKTSLHKQAISVRSYLKL
ncbi:hypothetical protein KL930_002254 [Ogataea haglerorum]|uniref:Small ribosomal subunit protein uS7 domain-containing protein n=1 Tax=Ogataea haglerorum TaxID=1937702 RepID=A0AAN6D705_9ASCO|nr:hypothetical protein KL915_001250 [Ogataea haglerorum]KAG7710000.1 hypothetical protein KL914_000910 [Ogataea haglerorum]KAG7711218.1 hypothetical protein KL950_001184 [Ogataea haglerorum]KAG7720516.1 hypothetical protein KL913_001416 [Ogataea haglerorum]KAG7720902.1 hypothetical protein KL949_001774 [Ogataea haglerorum]